MKNHDINGFGLRVNTRPNHVVEVKLPKGLGSLVVEIPAHNSLV